LKPFLFAIFNKLINFALAAAAVDSLRNEKTRVRIQQGYKVFRET
jgi:hypothetical protein